MMVIGSRYNLNCKELYLLSNIRINNNVCQFLGIYLDERLDFDVQIEDVCKKILLDWRP